MEQMVVGIQGTRLRIWELGWKRGNHCGNVGNAGNQGGDVGNRDGNSGNQIRIAEELG